MNATNPWGEKWTEIRPLSGGGQGDTILVKSVQEETKQAVLKRLKQGKVESPKARRRMFQEVANLKILRDAGAKVPEVLDHNTERFEDTSVPLYFVMEYIIGTTLADLVERSDGLSLEISISIALELCATTRIAVKEGIVHRDIKPENIMVRSPAPADVVMVDFGLSFNEDDDHKLTSVDETLENRFLTLPERRGVDENKRDPRSDLTGICAILHYCLTKCVPGALRDSSGKPPHQRPNYLLSGKVQNETQLSALNMLLNRGFNYELDSRFQTIDELTNRLEEILKPGSKEINEDLETVLIRETAALRKNDRTTQLNEYFRNVQPLQQSMTLRFNEIQGRLQKHRDFFYLQHESTQIFFQKLSEKKNRGDLFARTKIGCGAQNHNIFLQIQYEIIAQGSECSINREIYKGYLHDPPAVLKQIDTSVLVLRYQGDSNLSQSESAVVVADMEKAVSKAIALLSHRIQNPD